MKNTLKILALMTISFQVVACTPDSSVDTASTNSLETPTTDSPKLEGVYLFSQSQPGEFIAAENTTVVMEDDVAILTSTVPDPDPSGKTQGVRYRIAHDLEEKVRGKRINVQILAKADPNNPSEEFAVVYSTRMNGNSGWTTFNLSEDYSLFTFEYDVPVATLPPNFDFIGINADTSAVGKGMIIKGVALDVVG